MADKTRYCFQEAQEMGPSSCNKRGLSLTKGVEKKTDESA